MSQHLVCSWCSFTSPCKCLVFVSLLFTTTKTKLAAMPLRCSVFLTKCEVPPAAIPCDANVDECRQRQPVYSESRSQKIDGHL